MLPDVRLPILNEYSFISAFEKNILLYGSWLSFFSLGQLSSMGMLVGLTVHSQNSNFIVMQKSIAGNRFFACRGPAASPAEESERRSGLRHKTAVAQHRQFPDQKRKVFRIGKLAALLHFFQPAQQRIGEVLYLYRMSLQIDFIKHVIPG